MAATDTAPLSSRDEPRSRNVRAETRPPHYWRRWATDAVPDAQPPDPGLAPSAEHGTAAAAGEDRGPAATPAAANDGPMPPLDGAVPHPDRRGRPLAGLVRAKRAAQRRHAGTDGNAGRRCAAGDRRIPAGTDPDGPAHARPGRHAPDCADPPATAAPAAADRVSDQRPGSGAAIRSAGQWCRRFPDQADPPAAPDRRGLQPHPPRAPAGAA